MNLQLPSKRTSPSSPLNLTQRTLLAEFYRHVPVKLALDKKKRQEIWRWFKANRTIPAGDLAKECASLVCELEKSMKTGRLLQSAVFSECVYAKALATTFNLDEFYTWESLPAILKDALAGLLESNGFKPRYVYVDQYMSRALIQAGGFAGVDCALVFLHSKEVIPIEFKEPSAKISELDLPAYGEDGSLAKSDSFATEFPQFLLMLEEQLGKRLIFFDVLGSNVNDYTPEAVEFAVTHNYMGAKRAEVICVEDRHVHLTMLPVNHVGQWASKVRGEIRPAGRNTSSVFTPHFLERAIGVSGGTIQHGKVEVPVSSLKSARRRGGRIRSADIKSTLCSLSVHRM